MELFSEDLRSFWHIWVIRILMLASIFFQTTLTLLGSRRKNTAGIWIRTLVWFAYLAADWVAIIALSNISARYCPCACVTYSRELSNDLLALWAAVLLLHLGGTDNITAYSLEDNELWNRHLLDFIGQAFVAFLAFLSSWSKTLLAYVTIPIFIIGLAKYVERILALNHSSTGNFIASSVSDPCPKFVRKAMRERRENPQGGGSDQLYNAFFLFMRFERLFAGLILSNEEATRTYDILHGQRSSGDAFHVVAVELEIMYDMLYTKARIVFSKLGIFIRFTSSIAFVSILVVFSVLIMDDIHAYKGIDITITYILLVGAIVLEDCAFMRHVLSDLAIFCLTNSGEINRTTYDAMCTSYPFCTNEKRWSGVMGQFNLISYCIREMSPTCIGGVLKLFGIERYMYLSWVDVRSELKEIIFIKLKQEIKENVMDSLLGNIELRRRVLAQRGEQVHLRYGLKGQFNWCTTDVEFEHSLLVWHIATHMCYYQDTREYARRQIGKCLSDYMLYLLVLCPSIMPKGIGQLRFRETCTDTVEFFRDRAFGRSHSPIQAAELLFKIERPGKDGTLSVLNDGCRLAHQLQSLESRAENPLSHFKKWNMICEAWVEMLTYAAVQSGWTEHIEQLKNGGELLTHVRLLMAHLGLSEQYRSYGRAIP